MTKVHPLKEAIEGVIVLSCIYAFIYGFISFCELAVEFTSRLMK